MSNAKLEAARELLKEKHYSQARAVLETIDHPSAKDWLSKLDRIAPSRKLKNESDKDLAHLCHEEYEFKELAWRLKELTWKFEGLSVPKDRFNRVYALSESLCDNLSSSNEELIRNSCYLLSQIPTNYYRFNDDPRISLLAETLIRNQRDSDEPSKQLGFDAESYSRMEQRSRIHSYAQVALMTIGTPQARAAVLAIPFDDEWPVPIYIKKLSEGEFVSSTPDMIHEYAVFERNNLLFSLKIVRTDPGVYRLDWPTIFTIKEHFGLVELAYEFASYDLDRMELEDDQRRQEEGGWRTYMNDIAPYIDDDI